MNGEDGVKLKELMEKTCKRRNAEEGEKEIKVRLTSQMVGMAPNFHMRYGKCLDYALVCRWGGVNF